MSIGRRMFMKLVAALPVVGVVASEAEAKPQQMLDAGSRVGKSDHSIHIAEGQRWVCDGLCEGDIGVLHIDTIDGSGFVRCQFASPGCSCHVTAQLEVIAAEIVRRRGSLAYEPENPIGGFHEFTFKRYRGQVLVYS